MATVKGHKEYLGNLEDADPEFFAFLKENDAELLNFEDESEADEEDEEDGLHKPPEDLEVASDSEAEEELLGEDEEESSALAEQYLKKRIVNIHVIAEWEKKLSNTRDLPVLINVIDALGCAVEVILEGNDPTGLKWKVEGSTNFNALMRLCLKNVKGFCARFIVGNNNQETAENLFDNKPFEIRDKNNQKWKKLRPRLKLYMESMIAFLKSAGNSEALVAALRHVQKMSGFWAIMGLKAVKMIRVLITLWSQAEDSCRVLAFLTLMRMTNHSREIFLAMMLKRMYIAFVATSKFTSANTWPGINFMRHSLVEMYLLDTAVSYTIAFPFIRQLAIHLRNAVTAGTGTGATSKTTKTEAARVIYSWQFMHSLHLWADVLSNGMGDANLKLLIYPVVQTCMGTIKLIPSKKFIPLRFHILRMLISIQDKTKQYIPVLPMITEILHLIDFSSKSVAKFSVRPIDLTCCLKADIAESGYLKAVTNNIFDCLVGACSAICMELSFPDIVTPTVIQLKSFVKKDCKNFEVTKKFKGLLDKIEENSAYIKRFRDKAMDDGQISLADQNKMQILRIQLETAAKPAPLMAYSTEYFKKSKVESAKFRHRPDETKEEKLIPKGAARKSVRKETVEPSDGLFDDSDEEDGFNTKLDAAEEEDEEIEEAPKPKKRKNDKASAAEAAKQKKKAKKAKKALLADTGREVQDKVVDLNFSDSD